MLADLRESSHSTPWLTAREAADHLRVPVKRIYNLTSARAVPHVKQDGRVLFNRHQLDEWLSGHREGPR